MKYTLCLFALLLTAIYVNAAPANPEPFKVLQPNGDAITIRHVGDEYGSHFETIDGYIIDKDADGYWRYASAVVNDKIQLADIVTNTDQANRAARKAINQLQVREYLSLSRQRTKALLLQTENNVTQEPLPAKAAAVSGESAVKTGNVKILTILIQFPDYHFQQPNSVKQYYTDLMNKRDFIAYGDNVPTGSVSDYWREVSYGKLNVTSVVVGPFTASKKKSEYWTKEKDYENARKLAKEAVDAAAKVVNMADFDGADSDNVVDAVNIVYAGFGADDWDNGNKKEDIWPHRWSFVVPIYADGVKIKDYCMTPERYGTDYRGKGTMCHELGHIFGAADFYDTDEYGTGGYYHGTGLWDLMGSGSLNNGTKSPAHPNPWLKAYLWRWSTVQEISGTNRLYTLYPTETGANRIYRLTSAVGDFFLLENKQQDHINTNMGNSKGLVIFHVHKDMNNAVNSTFWKSNEVNTGHPQRVYVIDPNSQHSVPTGSVESYSWEKVNRSFTSNMRPLFTSTTIPNNLGWSQQPLSSPKDITMIREETAGGEKVIRFILNPAINGDYKFCDDEVFSIDHVPADATTEWGIKRANGQYVVPSGLKVASANRSSATYVRNGLSTLNPSTGEITTGYSYGKRTLTAKVSMFGQPYEMTKEVNLVEFKNVKFKLSELSSNVFYPGATRTFSIENPVEGPEGNISWIVSGSAMHSTKILTGAKIAVAPDKVGQMTVTVIDGNGCAPYNETSSSYRVLDLTVIIPVNPAQGTAEFSVVLRSDGTSEEDGSGVVTAMSTGRYNSMSGCYEEPYNGAYRIELWHKQYGMVRSVDMAEGNPNTQMDIAGLTPGDYIVRLIVDGSLTRTAQLRVK